MFLCFIEPMLSCLTVILNLLVDITVELVVWLFCIVASACHLASYFIYFIYKYITFDLFVDLFIFFGHLYVFWLLVISCVYLFVILWPGDFLLHLLSYKF